MCVKGEGKFVCTYVLFYFETIVVFYMVQM